MEETKREHYKGHKVIIVKMPKEYNRFVGCEAVVDDYNYDEKYYEITCVMKGWGVYKFDVYPDQIRKK